ncbi:MAG: hypothetical protein CMJ95_08610 [Planctomycetes bacterium]|nr:hypothetical protein [Planctomycetota bacterium]
MTEEKHPRDWNEVLENTLANSQEQSLSLATSGQGAQTDYMGLALLLALMLAVGIYLWKSGLTARMKNPDDPLFVRASAYSATIMSLFFLLIYLWSDLATETRFIGTSMVIMLPFFFYLTGEALMRGLKQQDDRTQERIQALEAALAELKEKPAV